MKKKILYILLLGLFKSNKKACLLFDAQTRLLQKKYNVLIDFSRLRITKINQIRLNDLVLVWNDKFSVAIKEISFSFLPMGLFRGKPLISLVGIKMNSVHVKRTGGKRERAFPPQDAQTGTDHFKKITRLYKKASRLIFSYPANITITGLSFEERELSNIRSVRICDFHATVVLQALSETIVFSGNIRSDVKSIALKAQTEFDSAKGIGAGSILLEFKETWLDELSGYMFSCSLKIEHLKIKHRYIGNEACYFKNVDLAFKVALDKDKIAFTEDSAVTIDNCPISCRLFSLKKDWPTISILCLMELDRETIGKITAHFQNGLFHLGPAARLTIMMVCKFDLYDPQKQFFNINIRRSGLDADSVAFDLDYLRLPFVHTVHLKGGEKKEIALSANESEKFIPIRDIALLLPRLFIFCEDPDFYKHAGVDSYFIGKAIVANIKSRKIVRGASTITMQLAKNLFLTPETSILRKLEEVSISLLMETVFKIPKDRILEIYMNVIEFGPGIYGVKEGCHFYFSKHPNDLTLTELIVLTYIIPRPIHFYDALLIKAQQLTTNLGNYIGETGRRLLQHKVITTENYESLDKKIVFSNRFGILDLSHQNNSG